MKVYVYTCPACGQNGIRIKRLKARGAEIIETRNNPEVRKEHIRLLDNAGMTYKTVLPSIVVEDKTITLLEEWKWIN